MKSTVKQVRIRPHSEEWFKFRYDNGFGGSEIASVVASKSRTLAELVYTPPIKLFLSKIGDPIQEFTGNVESESGHFFEPIILEWLKHYDLDHPDQYLMFQNLKAKNRVNKVIQPKTFCVNTKYPWLFYSTDAWHWKNKTGGKRIAECKNTTSFEAKRYQNGISPSFYCQIMQGLLITEVEAADLCVLIDGRWFSVVTIEPDKTWFDLILDTSHEMWKNIIKARAIKIEYDLPAYFGINPDTLTERQKEGAMLLSELEPPMAGTEGELEFVKEMVIPQVEETIKQGSEEGLKLCIEYLKLDEKEKEFSSKKKELYAKILLELGSDCNVYIWDEKPVFTYKPDKRGTCRLLVSQEIKNLYGDKF